MADIFNPPAIVSTARQDSRTKAKALNLSISTGERKTAQEIIELGKVLWEIKKECTVKGEWTKELAIVGVNQQRASEAMRAANLPNSVGCKLLTLADLRKSISPCSDETDDMPEPEKDDPDAVPESLDIRKPGQEKWCSRCVRLGAQTSGCSACTEVAKPAPGKQPKQPLTVYDDKVCWRSYNHWGVQVEAFAKQNKLAKDPTYLELKEIMTNARHKFNELQKKASE